MRLKSQQFYVDQKYMEFLENSNILAAVTPKMTMWIWIRLGKSSLKSV